MVTVFISSCDKRKACWMPLCHSLRKYWPDCPWPIGFVTNSLIPPCGMPIMVGADQGWSGTMKLALERITDDVVFLLLDDWWLTAPPDTAALLDFARIVEVGHAEHIGLYPTWGKVGNLHVSSKGPYAPDSRLKVFAPRSAYRTSLMPGFWRTKTLRALLVPGESAQQFEINASRRSEGNDRFLCAAEYKHFRYVVRNEPHYTWGPVMRGNWTRDASHYAKKEGLDMDFSRPLT